MKVFYRQSDLSPPPISSVSLSVERLPYKNFPSVPQALVEHLKVGDRGSLKVYGPPPAFLVLWP